MKKILLFILLLSFSAAAQEGNHVVDLTKGMHGYVVSVEKTIDNYILFTLCNIDDENSVIKYRPDSWTKYNFYDMFGETGYHMAVTPDDNGNIYATEGGKLYRFENGEWDTLGLPMPPSYKYPNIAKDNNGNIWVSGYIYTDKILKISGDEIEDMAKEISPNVSIKGLAKITVDNDSVWICTRDGVVKYVNGAITRWDTSNSNIPTAYPIVYYKDSQNRKWIGSADTGLIRWVDDTTFVTYNTGNSVFTNNFVNDITEGPDGTLWIATDKGLVSFKDGVFYKHTGEYSDYSIIDIAVDNEGYVYMGTLGSLFRYDGKGEVTSVNENNTASLTETFTLKQNYPNPFNPATSIEYFIPEPGNVQLKVYDILGNEIAEPVNRYLRAGTYKTEFDASELPSGVYIYTLRASGLTISRKMLLLK